MKIDKELYPTYAIIADGGVSMPEMGEGRLIPSVMVESHVANEVYELTEIHKASPPGDIKTTWVRPISYFKKPKELILKLQFTSPVEITFGIKFDLFKHANLIDGVVASQGIVLTVGSIGDKISEQFDNGIIIEVPKTNFSKNWDKMFFDAISEKYRKKGIQKKKIKELVMQHIESTRELWNMRRPNA